MGVISNGTTLLDAGALDSGVATGSMTLIKDVTISSGSANVTFVHGTSDVVLDSTYKVYVFKFINVHPQTDNHYFLCNFRDGGSNFDATKYTTFMRSLHLADDSSEVAYISGDDVNTATADQRLANGVGNAASESVSGTLTLYDPSNTTFQKHFNCRTQFTEASPGTTDVFVQGLIDVTAAVDGVLFKAGSGNLDSGNIKLYGIK